MELAASQLSTSNRSALQTMTREDIYQQEQDLVDEEARIVAEQYDRLELQLSTEVLNERWASDLTQRIEAGLSRSPLGEGIVSNIECRSTLCRIDTFTDDGQSINATDLYRAIPGLSDAAPHAMTFRDADGGRVLFIGRSGFPLEGS
jgi:hypothetical protein